MYDENFLYYMEVKFLFAILCLLTDEENVKTFLSGLEDGSAGRSEDNDFFVFLAKYATELW